MRTTRNILLGLTVLAMGISTLQASNNNTQKGRKSSNEWISIGPSNVSGRILAVHVDISDSRIMYAGTAGSGLWISTNSGGSWRRCTGYEGPVAVSAIAQSSDGKLFIGTGEGLNNVYASPGVMSNFAYWGIAGNGIHISTDRGATFSHVTSTKDWEEVNAMAYDAKNNKLYVATDAGLKVSTDNTFNTFKEAWQGSGSANKTFDVKVGTDGSVICSFIRGLDGDVFLSTDNGESFKSVCGTKNTELPNDLGRFSVAIAPSNSDMMYAMTEKDRGDFGGVYLSTDKGITWRAIFRPGGYDNPMDMYNQKGMYANAIAVSPTNPYRVLLGSTHLWEMDSTSQIDQGKMIYRRSEIMKYANVHSIFYRGETICLATQHGIYYSDNDGRDYLDRGRGLNTLQVYSMSVANDGRIMAGTRENGVIYMANPVDSGSYGVRLLGNDGGRTAFSYLKTDALHYLSFYGTGYRQASFESDAQTTNQWYGGKESSILATSTSKYPRWYPRESGGISPNYTNAIISPLVVWETTKDCNSKDTIRYIADKDYARGEKICTKSVRNNRYPVWTTNTNSDTLRRDSILLVRDSVISRFFLGGGPFIGKGEQVGAPVYMSLSSISYDEMQEWICVFRTKNTSEQVMDLLVSNDGNHLFVLTNKWASGEYTIYRVSGFDTYREKEELDVFAYGYGDTNAGTFTTNPNRKLINDTLKLDLSLGDDILSISLDPLNDDNLIFTTNSMGGFFPRIMLVTNATTATSSTTIIESKEGSGIPENIPVFTALKVLDPKGKIKNTAYIGTEKGIYKTDNFNNSSPTWEIYNRGINIDVPVFQLLQQTKFIGDVWSENFDGSGNPAYDHFPGVYNYGIIYAATYGAGFFLDSTYFEPYVGVKEYPKVNYVDNKIKIYPNPANSTVFVDFVTPTNGQIQLNIVDITGKIIYTENLGTKESESYSHILDCSYLPNGFYFINIKTGNYNKTGKLVISK
jgi:hypothetical protein